VILRCWEVRCAGEWEWEWCQPLRFFTRRGALRTADRLNSAAALTEWQVVDRRVQ
jgi:hypothetical protein